VIVHGFPTEPLDAHQSAMTVPQLADRVASDFGWAALTLTLSGCGTSEGDFALSAWLEDLANAVAHLQESVSASPIVITGTGLGGPLALAVGATDPEIAGVAALAPQVDLSDWGSHARRLVEHAREIGAIRTPGFPTDLESWANEFRRFDPLGAARRFAPRPLLIICGSEDERFPLSEARSLAEAHGSAELRVLPGGGNRPRHDPRAVAILMGWLSRTVIGATG
jgi:putative redox protein